MGEVKLPFKPDLVIFDLDDCLISHHSAFYDAFRHAAATEAIRFLPEMNYEEAVRIVVDAYKDEGFSFTAFSRAPYNLPLPQFFNACFDATYRDGIKPVENEYRLKHDFMQSALGDKDTDFAVLTHGSKKWAERLVELTGLSSVIPTENIFSVEQSDFILKDVGKEPFETVLRATGHENVVDMSKIIMVEDTCRNLKIPKEMGLTTVHITSVKQADQEQEKNIDYSFGSMADFICALP